MKSNGTLALVQSIYDHVHLALWASLVALVLFFVAFTVPKLPEAAARAERLRVQKIAQENEGYCAKWQMGLWTKMHDQCISDLQELRWKTENRFADRFDF
jgi:nitric oxide reductase large subunit